PRPSPITPRMPNACSSARRYSGRWSARRKARRRWTRPPKKAKACSCGRRAAGRGNRTFNQSHNHTGVAMAFIEKFGPLIGRILIALLYIKSGWGKLTGFEGIVKYIASAGLPMPSVGAVIAILVELPVAIALVVGFKARYAALIMAVFTLAAAILFHNYWTM